ncbi:pyocin knob domain-containing protein, partial [Escherichia albertii]|uniref:pyocin knob domain-containing protein n=2 Tax=Escherichia albertii TaxID=208962 RepID=UPI0035A2560A
LSTANTWSARQTFNGGITGALAGNADTATKLKTKRSLQVDLQSDNAIDFDGSSNALLGIKGILPITHGGLGASSVSGGRTNLGLGVADIPQFKGINLVNSTDADVAASGIVSGYLNNSAGVQRSRFRIYSEIRSDNRSWLTLHLQSDTNTNKYAGLDIDGNFLITGDSKCRALEPSDVALTRKNIDVYSKAEVDLKKGMKFTRVNAPSGAEEGKFYPVVIKRSTTSNGELASRVIISTAPRQAAHRMNNCEFNGFVMPAGWSDRGRYAYGMFWQYQDAERAIHSIAMSNKDDEVSSVFYIEGGAFPVCVLVEEGLSVVVPTTDYIVGQTTYKWGATNPKAECIAADIIIDFSNGRGFYSSGNLNGNAATATKLQTACTINGVSFDGSEDIELTAEDLNLEQTVELAAGAVPATRKVNGHALTSDINVTSQDIFNGQSISIGANQNLNDYMTPGLYHQLLNANTSSALNYPENNAGNLIVLKNAGVKQIYHVYNSSRVWSRSKYSSEPWTPWAREYNSQSKPTPAELAVLALAGGSMSGSIKFINDAFLIWERNTDWAKIGFKNDSDSDTDSYLWFETGDNGNEYFKWRIRAGSTTKDLMFLKSDALRVTGQIIPSNYGNFDSRYQAKNTASKAANGWHKDVSTGIITQWGYISNAGAGLTFPIAFPSACTSITITNAHGRFDYSIAVNSLSRTGAKFNSEGNGNMYWTAIGY